MVSLKKKIIIITMITIIIIIIINKLFNEGITKQCIAKIHIRELQ